jgi:hypothetical protein
MMNTTWFESSINPLDAKVTGSDNIPFNIILGGAKRASLYTSLAPNTQLLAKHYNPIRPLGYCPDGATLLAGGSAAMPAAPGNEFQGPFPTRFYRPLFEYANPMFARLETMFLFTSNFTGKTTKTFIRIKEQRLLNHFPVPPPYIPCTGIPVRV